MRTFAPLYLVLLLPTLAACHEAEPAAAGDDADTAAPGDDTGVDATSVTTTDAAADSATGADATTDQDVTTPPDDTDAGDADPIDTTPDDTEPDDTTPDDTGPADTAAEDVDPGDTTPEDTAPPEDTTLVDTDPGDTTPEDTGPPDTGIVDTWVEPEIVVPPWNLVVNEVDCRGTPTEWVEVVNVGTLAVPLADVWITDDVDAPTHKTPLGAGDAVLQPGGRLVVDLSLFSIACGSEGVVLGRFDDEVIDTSPAGNDPTGHTYGRLPDASGNFTITKPTRGAPNAAPDFDPFDQIGTLYDPLHAVPTIDLTIEDWAVDSLWDSPYEWVPATFTLTDDVGVFTQPAAVRLKGRIGSWRDLNGKSAFKVDFDRFWPGARFRGVEAMTLNNMVQDNAKTHEALAYALFRAMGVPAPRLGYVWVRVNGDDFGFYANLEAYEDPFFDHHFESTKSMFEGQYGDDLFDGTAFEFDLDEGGEEGRLDLMALIQAVQDAPATGFMAATDALVDWQQVTRMMATEVMIGHWDGYAPTRNNYYLHVDDLGVWRMMPWGTDQTFEDNRGWYSGQGLLFQGCVNDPPCLALYQDALVALAVIVQEGAAIDALRDVPAAIQPYIDDEPREGGGVNAQSRFNSAVDFIERRANEVLQDIGCARDPDLDLDGDGYGCDLDCNEGDPDVHVGATEICGDFIDQDCNDRIDDGVDCPDCTAQQRNGVDYLFCYTERTHDAAATMCAGEGMSLVVINGSNENGWVRDTASTMGLASIWLGLDDLAQEGTFVWDDGVAASTRFRDWISGEPNNYGSGEDCVQLLPDYGNDTWNDVSCTGLYAVVCEKL